MNIQTEKQSGYKLVKKFKNRTVIFFILFITLAFNTIHAGSREQAKRIHDRLAGVTPSDSVLDLMTIDVTNLDPEAAAIKAMENSAFYNVTLKNFAAPWTNRDESVFVPLNDYTATVIGMVRDNVPFNTLLSADLVYTSNASGLPAYSMANNNHYEQAEANNVDLKATLVSTQQSAVTTLPPNATAGVMTSRAAAEAFFVAGTNRAMYRFTMLNHLCKDLEEIKDGTRSADRIRQDISRSPGGDSRLFLNNCVSCHTGMEPLAQAYAYYNFNETTGSIEYTAGQVQPKYLINDTNFINGYVTPDDRWDNYWRTGSNALLGWDTSLPSGGNGAKTMGQELANSDAFASCQVKKAFKAVCFRDPVDAADRAKVAEITTSFKIDYVMKPVFAKAAAYCMGE